MNFTKNEIVQWFAESQTTEEECEEEGVEGFVDVEERVQEVMLPVIAGETDVGIEKRQVDIDERAMVMAMLESTCGCNKGLSSQPCSTQFSADHLMSVRSSCSEISCSELDMMVMGQLMTGMDDTSTTNPHSRNKEKPRQRVAYSLYHQGKLHTIGETR